MQSSVVAPAPPAALGGSHRWRIPSRYEVRQVIGTGSYGSVCEAHDTEHDRLVAVKRVRHLFDDLIDCKRILREVAILSRLSHDFVVHVHEILTPGPSANFDELYIVMEICDSDLKKLCRTDVTLTPLHINTLLYNLLIGVKYLHSAGIMHRDLKPANCLVNQDCSVKICDFGLSRAIGGEELPLDRPANGVGDENRPPTAARQPARRHLTGHVVTRWYRAPELILLQEKYTAAIDLWSVGCIYAELLGMLDGFRIEDRRPLFPGTSCFPLSPENRRGEERQQQRTRRSDQLNMIFNLLGTPSDGDVAELERDDARSYIRHFERREGSGLRAKFPQAPAESLDILSNFLHFSPNTRLTVTQALTHPLFDDLRDPAREASSQAREVIVLDFESERDLDEALLRRYFRQETRRFGSDEDSGFRHLGS
mmetsp:Transcript_113800/g.327029  ORF Transcript_113800/g.327029 Transcript_113800/m.327029 type:complete len:425 (+) Transcript_113800:107-1381(+)